MQAINYARVRSMQEISIQYSFSVRARHALTDNPFPLDKEKRGERISFLYLLLLLLMLR
jgi:hypothetical protein